MSRWLAWWQCFCMAAGTLAQIGTSRQTGPSVPRLLRAQRHAHRSAAVPCCILPHGIWLLSMLSAAPLQVIPPDDVQLVRFLGSGG